MQLSPIRVSSGNAVWSKVIMENRVEDQWDADGVDMIVIALQVIATH